MSSDDGDFMFVGVLKLIKEESIIYMEEKGRNVDKRILDRILNNAL